MCIKNARQAFLPAGRNQTKSAVFYAFLQNITLNVYNISDFSEIVKIKLLWNRTADVSERDHKFDPLQLRQVIKQ